jgi:uncharacterized protein DUF955
VTHWRLADGSEVQIVNFIDDHSRLVVASRVLASATAPAVLEVFREAGARWGLPAALLTDNGCVYTTWHRRGPNVMQTELLALGIDYRHSRPYHPQTCNRGESMRVAELQAAKLLAALNVGEPPIPENVVASLPRIRVDRMSPIPVSGSAHWAKGTWVIVLNGAEPLVRQRFSLAHEFKHVLDAPFDAFLYPETLGVTSHERAEQVADYFAACLLMPKIWMRRAWTSGVQRLPALARRFGVSQTAMQVRLLQMGLLDPPARCYGREKKMGVAA